MRMSRIPTLLSIAVMMIAPSLAAQLPPVNLTGTWNLNTSIMLSGETTTCEFQGLATIMNTGSTIAGTAQLTLISGPASCPAEMSASLDGTVMNVQLLTVGGTLSGPIGVASFTGTLSPNPGGGGAVQVVQGPFAGEGGTWTAQLLTNSIPLLTPVGLTLLVLTLLGTGMWLLRNQATA